MLALITEAVLITIHDAPFWTDAYGYCKPIPGYAEGVHRPYGLEPMTIALGDTLNFLYSVHHDVWSHPTHESLEQCDYSAGTLLAGREAGGGCEDETDHYGCMATAYMNDAGYMLTPDAPGTYCTPRHCSNPRRQATLVCNS